MFPWIIAAVEACRATGGCTDQEAYDVYLMVAWTSAVLLAVVAGAYLS